MPPSSFQVTLGTVNADGSGGETHWVKSVHVDPDYVATNGTGSDVVAARARGAGDHRARQIAAPVRDSDLWEPGDVLTIAGFGVTEEDGDAPAASRPPRSRA